MKSARFNLTPKYFSDLIRAHTGRSAQHQIYDKLIEAGKERLSVKYYQSAKLAFCSALSTRSLSADFLN